MKKPTFSENVIIITGASAGIGHELALQLADRGAWLVLAARNAEGLEKTAELCIKRGGRALSIPTDVTKKSQCENLIRSAIAEYKRIDTLVNNAGITMWARFDEVEDLDTLERIMQVNYFGSMYCTHYALPFLKESKGLIVGVSSLTGKTGVPTRTAYAASKHAMVGFFDSLRIELKDSGVSVTMVYPGFVATEVRKRAIGPDGKPLGKSPVHEEDVMTVESCSKLIINAMATRKRELVMTMRAKIGLWLKLIAPSIPDKIAARAIEQGR